MSFSGTGKVWMNGKIVDWADANIHVASHVVHYASAVFEGIRSYKTQTGSALFRLDAHMRRLYDSARIYRMDYGLRPRTPSPRRRRHHRSERARSVLHPAAVLSRLSHARRQSAALSRRCRHSRLGVGLLSGRQRVRQGVDVCVSSWPRNAPNTTPAMAKSVANYANSGLIKMEAALGGLRRRHRARPERPDQRRQRPEPVPRPRRDDPHAAGGLLGAPGHHTRHDPHAGPGPRNCGARARHAARNALRRRRGMFLSAPPSRSRRFDRSTRSPSAKAAAGRSRPRCRRRSSITSRAVRRIVTTG